MSCDCLTFWHSYSEQNCTRLAPVWSRNKWLQSYLQTLFDPEEYCTCGEASSVFLKCVCVRQCFCFGLHLFVYMHHINSFGCGVSTLAYCTLMRGQNLCMCRCLCSFERACVCVHLLLFVHACICSNACVSVWDNSTASGLVCCVWIIKVVSLIIKSLLSWWEPEEGDGVRERGRGIIVSAAGVHALPLLHRVVWLRCVMSTSLLCSLCSPT